jgi:hypothetical protein
MEVASHLLHQYIPLSLYPLRGRRGISDIPRHSRFTKLGVTGGKPIAVLLQSISGVSAINPLVAFYEIHGVKREVLFFYFVPDTTRDTNKLSLFHLRYASCVRVFIRVNFVDKAAEYNK